MRAPVLAVGDGALGFWAAVPDVFPDTTSSVAGSPLSPTYSNYLPKSAQPGARAALAEIYNAEDREHALKAVKAFEADYGVKWLQGAAKTTYVLLEFYSYRRALDPSTHDQPDRVDLRDRPGFGSASEEPPARELLASRWPSTHGVAQPALDGGTCRSLVQTEPSSRRSKLVDGPTISRALSKQGPENGERRSARI